MESTMIDNGMSRDSYSDSPALTPELYPAHSGPELASCVPDPGLAQDLARELVANNFELTQTLDANCYAAHSSSGSAIGFTIGLARR
jgi:hypothetical protein